MTTQAGATADSLKSVLAACHDTPKFGAQAHKVRRALVDALVDALSTPSGYGGCHSSGLEVAATACASVFSHLHALDPVRDPGEHGADLAVFALEQLLALASDDASGSLTDSTLGLVRLWESDDPWGRFSWALAHGRGSLERLAVLQRRAAS